MGIPFKDLEVCTDNFSEENFIGKFQFGKLYRGKIEQNGSEQCVLVKIYEDPVIYKVCHPEGNDWIAGFEYCMLCQEGSKKKPAFAKVIGYCTREVEGVGAIYDIKPRDTVYNLIFKDSFTWLQRIKVALQFANLLEHLHHPKKLTDRSLLCNISAAHIMLDQDNNVKLIDYALMRDRNHHFESKDFEGIFGCYGYIDPALATTGSGFTERVDIFAFGVLLLELIAKRRYDPEKDKKNVNIPLVHEWAWREYKSKISMTCFGLSKRSLVHQSLEADPDFCSSDGHKITKLAMQCVNYCPKKRPTLWKVNEGLLDLHFVRHNKERLGIGELDRGRDPDWLNPTFSEVMEDIYQKSRIWRLQCWWKFWYSTMLGLWTGSDVFSSGRVNNA